MDRIQWKKVEDTLDSFGIKPLVAVVADNQDPELMAGSTNPEFWDLVRAWQAKGWAIGMHGYTHVMHPTNAPQILPFYKRSEFSGLSYSQQAEKIRAAKAIFDSQGVRLDAWIAPAHCFDLVTLDAIRSNTEIRIISDGIATSVYYEMGFFWVPQQLWKFRKFPFGLWTVCCHPTMMSDSSYAKFSRDIAANADRIVRFQDIELVRRRRTLLDRVAHALFWLKRGQCRTALR
jgi:predicted deacetylase